MTYRDLQRSENKKLSWGYLEGVYIDHEEIVECLPDAETFLNKKSRIKNIETFLFLSFVPGRRRKSVWTTSFYLKKPE